MKNAPIKKKQISQKQILITFNLTKRYRIKLKDKTFFDLIKNIFGGFLLKNKKKTHFASSYI